MFLGKTFQKLESEQFKGDNGIIAVLGGSYMYTGAPIFSALSALRAGADLAYIFTDKEAVGPIKTLKEAIVMPYEIVPRILGKVTAVVIGPGLGEVSKPNLEIILQIIDYINERSIPIIVDGDAIHLYKEGYFKNVKNLIITPNHNESQRLVLHPDHICIYKNKIDIVQFKETKAFVFNESSYKRCGGQGDILAGILATACSLNPNDLFDCCISACELTRLSAKLAFEMHGYSLITSDIFNFIHLALKRIQKSS